MRADKVCVGTGHHDHGHSADWQAFVYSMTSDRFLSDPDQREKAAGMFADLMMRLHSMDASTMSPLGHSHSLGDCSSYRFPIGHVSGPCQDILQPIPGMRIQDPSGGLVTVSTMTTPHVPSDDEDTVNSNTSSNNSRTDGHGSALSASRSLSSRVVIGTVICVCLIVVAIVMVVVLIARPRYLKAKGFHLVRHE